MLNKFALREVFDLYNNNLQTATNHQLQVRVCDVESCTLKGHAPEFPSASESAESRSRRKSIVARNSKQKLNETKSFSSTFAKTQAVV